MNVPDAAVSHGISFLPATSDIAGWVHEVLRHGKGVPSTFLPEPIVFALQWVALGFLSCCVLGCGGAFLLLALVPFVTTPGQAENAVSLAIVCYGMGTVLGEIPGYYVSWELFRKTRARLQSHHYPHGLLTSAYGLLRGQGAAYIPVLVISAIPLPVDLTAPLCAVVGAPLSDFIFPALVGKALIRTHLLIYLVQSPLFAQTYSTYVHPDTYDAKACSHLPEVC